MFVPAFTFIGLDQEDCCGCCGHENCGKRCAMLSSILAALLGIAGSGYCVIVAALGLEEGPRCVDASGHYLLDSSMWSKCVEPKHIVEWNVSLFSILLALGGIEFILCLIQVINGMLGVKKHGMRSMFMRHPTGCGCASEVSLFIHSYLLDSSMWSKCVEPKHIVEWNVSLFSILLALGGIEFILCLIQVINGMLGGVCGYCSSRQQ
ncbi:TM4SF1, partial [Cervus elaphus hippelaphus]